MKLSPRRVRPPAPSMSLFNGDLTRFRDEMDRTFARFFADPFEVAAVEPKMLRAEGWIPAIDVSETDTEITIRVEAPGIPVKDLDISVSGNTLTIAGQKEETSEKSEESFYHCERRFGSFRRSLDLPDTVDPNKVTAEADNGVVTIRVPKKPGAKPKQIEVTPIAKKISVAG
jgi:HSP20 family protein